MPGTVIEKISNKTNGCFFCFRESQLMNNTTNKIDDDNNNSNNNNNNITCYSFQWIKVIPLNPTSFIDHNLRNFSLTSTNKNTVTSYEVSLCGTQFQKFIVAIHGCVIIGRNYAFSCISNKCTNCLLVY